MQGYRKFIWGMSYLIGCFALAIGAMLKGQVGWDAAGLSALPTAIAAGLWTIVRGNVDEHRAKNGNGAK